MCEQRVHALSQDEKVCTVYRQNASCWDCFVDSVTKSFRKTMGKYHIPNGATLVVPFNGSLYSW